MKRVSYSVETKYKAVEMKAAGFSTKEIMKELNIRNRTQVKTWWRWYRNGESYRFSQHVGKQYTYGKGLEELSEVEQLKLENKRKDIEFLEKRSNGREDRKLILDICFLSIIPLISIYITYFLSFSNPFAIFILIITAVPVSYKIGKKLLDHMHKDEDRFLALHRNYEKGKLLFLTLPIIGLISIIGSAFLFDYLIFKLNNMSVEILGSIHTVVYQIIICFIQSMFTTMFLTMFIYTILVLIYGRFTK